MTTITEQKQLITITDAAAANIRNLLVERQIEDHCLRIYVAGIGCSGPQYGLAFDDNPRDNDNVLEIGELRVLVDPNSMAYLEGATIDYAVTPQGAGFKIDNPNPLAAASCGSCSGSCG